MKPENTENTPKKRKDSPLLDDSQNSSLTPYFEELNSENLSTPEKTPKNNNNLTSPEKAKKKTENDRKNKKTNRKLFDEDDNLDKKSDLDNEKKQESDQEKSGIDNVEKESETKKMADNFAERNIKILIFDFDLTILKISSTDYYHLGSEFEQLKDGHNKEVLKTWFADFELLESLLKASKAQQIKICSATVQSEEVVKAILAEVNLLGYFDKITGSKDSRTQKNKPERIIEMIKSQSAPEVGIAYFDDDSAMLEQVQSKIDSSYKVNNFYIENDLNDEENNGLNLKRLKKFNQKLKADQKSKDEETKSQETEILLSKAKAQALAVQQQRVKT